MTDTEETWLCLECDDTHLPSHRFCPKTGLSREAATEPTPPGVPRGWKDDPAGWHKFKAGVDRMTPEELSLCGLIHATEAHHDVAALAHPEGPPAAQAYRHGNRSALQVSMLPTVEGKDERPWAIIGPYMQRELFMVKFVALYLLGPVAEDELDLACKRITNEWHGLDPNEGLVQ